MDDMDNPKSIWRLSNRADREALPIADRHYNRQKVGSPQFVPPGRCVVLKTDQAVWVTSWPFAEYVKHEWAGAWVNSLFRREGGEVIASEMIRQAVAITRSVWEPPTLGIVSFIDPNEVKPRKIRGRFAIGESYFAAGWKHVGYTKAGLWVMQQLPHEMPDALEITEAQMTLEAIAETEPRRGDRYELRDITYTVVSVEPLTMRGPSGIVKSVPTRSFKRMELIR